MILKIHHMFDSSLFLFAILRSVLVKRMTLIIFHRAPHTQIKNCISQPCWKNEQDYTCIIAPERNGNFFVSVQDGLIDPPGYFFLPERRDNLLHDARDPVEKLSVHYVGVDVGEGYGIVRVE